MFQSPQLELTNIYISAVFQFRTYVDSSEMEVAEQFFWNFP